LSLVELAQYSNGMEAEIVRGRLSSEGIMAFCFDGCMNIADSAAYAIPVRVMVDEDEVAEARALLDEIARSVT
jgi:Putative prokaryotic signal transducing protein